MAGNSVRPASIGVGPALRRAREIAGTTLDEAARDTRLTSDQIGALEREDFELLGEEVYVRAMLRTYAQYLGLKPDKVMSAYARHAEEPELPSPPAKMGRVEQALAAARIRDNQRFLLLAAAVLTSLGPGESISYSAVGDLTVFASDGGAIRIVVDGRTLGVPGQAGHPWSGTFVPSGSAAQPSP